MIAGLDTSERTTRSRTALDDPPKESGWASFGKLAMFGVYCVVGFVYYGWAIQLMWGWFVAPTFGLPALSLVAAIGIDLLYSVLRGPPAENKEIRDEKDMGKLLGKAFGRLLVVPTFPLAIAYIVHRVA